MPNTVVGRSKKQFCSPEYRFAYPSPEDIIGTFAVEFRSEMLKARSTLIEYRRITGDGQQLKCPLAMPRVVAFCRSVDSGAAAATNPWILKALTPRPLTTRAWYVSVKLSRTCVFHVSLTVAYDETPRPLVRHFWSESSNPDCSVLCTQ